MKKTILKARALSKSFAHNGGQVHILSGVDLDIYEGDFTVIMGASGSGKSTMLYALSGMDKATAGSVIYNDRDIAGMNEKDLAALRSRDFGFIFQQMHLVSNLSLFENVAVPGYLNKERSADEVRKRAAELIDKMGISDVNSHLPSQVSGGEQQRCAVARAIINNPKLLFADEPTGALNRAASNDVMDVMERLNKEGTTIMMVTHDAKVAARCKRVLYLVDGSIVGEYRAPEDESLSRTDRERRLNNWLMEQGW